jgi:hypothetical protein
MDRERDMHRDEFTFWHFKLFLKLLNDFVPVGNRLITKKIPDHL